MYVAVPFQKLQEAATYENHLDTSDISARLRYVPWGSWLLRHYAIVSCYIATCNKSTGYVN